MYDFSRNEVDSGGFVYDYNICFVWISLSTFGPFLIQYASQMNLLYQKGAFSSQNLNRIGIFKKVCLFFQLTAIGLVLIPLIDILIKVHNVINVLFLPFCCCKRRGKALNERVHNCLTQFTLRLTNMNEFELHNFKSQSKYTQMLFEDLMMVLLDALVVFGVFSVPKVTS